MRGLTEGVEETTWLSMSKGSDGDTVRIPHSNGAPVPGPGFAVIDFETTGLFPGGHDRVVEAAVGHVDDRGAVTGQCKPW